MENMTANAYILQMSVVASSCFNLLFKCIKHERNLVKCHNHNDNPNEINWKSQLDSEAKQEVKWVMGKGGSPRLLHSMDYSLKCHVEMNTVLMFSYSRVSYLLSLQEGKFLFFSWVRQTCGLGKSRNYAAIWCCLNCKHTKTVWISKD